MTHAVPNQPIYGPRQPVWVLLLPMMLSWAPELAAQQQALLPDSMLMAIQPDRIGLVGGKGLKGAQKFIVPTVMLYLSASGQVRMSTQTLRTTASVTNEYEVLGLRQAFAAEAAGYVQSELARTFRARGLTVLLYDDIKGSTSMSTVQRLMPDADYGVPTVTWNSPRTTFAIVAPTEDQLFSGAALKKHVAFRNLARETGAVVLIPELWIQTPQFTRSRVGEAGQVAAGMKTSPAMDVAQASLTFITPSGSVGSITHMVPISDVSTGAGSLVRTGLDSTQLGNTLSAASLNMLSGNGIIGLMSARTAGGNRNTTASVSLVVSEDAYLLGVLRGAMSFLNSALTIIDRERRQ